MLLRVGSRSLPRTMLMSLKVGEILLIGKADWNQQNGPGSMCGKITRKYGHKFRVDTIADGSGWVVERLPD